MDFAPSDEHRMLKELVAWFVQDELMPLEPGVLAREADGKGLGIGPAEQKRLDEVSKSLGLWGLDAPEDVGGVDLPAVAMVGVNEELGKTVSPYTLPPDSPNLRMLAATVVVEAVFAIPGMGGLIVNAAMNRDFPVVQGVVFTMVPGLNVTFDYYNIKINDRIAQMAILPVLDVKLFETDKLSETERGSDGFGSSGV